MGRRGLEANPALDADIRAIGQSAGKVAAGPFDIEVEAVQDADGEDVVPRGQPVAAVGPVRVLASDQLDPEAVAARLSKRRDELRSEGERAERKLGNQGFVAKAPAEVVEEERGKLERYRSELAELE